MSGGPILSREENRMPAANSADNRAAANTGGTVELNTSFAYTNAVLNASLGGTAFRCAMRVERRGVATFGSVTFLDSARDIFNFVSGRPGTRRKNQNKGDSG